MGESQKVQNILSKIQTITKNPEKYLSIQDKEVTNVQSLLKELYDYTKANENAEKRGKNVLETLIVENFDEEQIWQELELQNDFACQILVTDIGHLLAKKEKLIFQDDKVKSDSEGSSNASDEDMEAEEMQDDESFNEDEGEEKEEEEEEEEEEKVAPKRKEKKKVESSIVDDKFFKLHEMEEFLKKVEEGDLEGKGDESDDEDDDDDSIDYFADNLSDKSENDMYYNDFFDEPDDNKVVSKKKRKKDDEDTEMEESEGKKTKKVKFAMDNEDDEDEVNGDEDANEDDNDEEINSNNSNKDEDEQNSDDEGDDSSDVDEGKKPSSVKSSFEARQERLKAKIESLEKEALSEKPWQMKGEVNAKIRPQNSLLEEYVEFDLAVRPAPVITEKCTLKLEDIIKQRIKDQVWDDVIRKIKPVEDIKEYKKKLVLDQEKSKLSLAEIYEQEYLKQRDSRNNEEKEVNEEVPAEHKEIQNMMKSLFRKLDALSNFHYTPKQAAPDIKIVSNLAAINVEEVAPTATSDAALLAPEEIKPKPKGDVIGKSERTDTDKKRERRQKKLKQRMREKEKLKKEKLVTKLNPGLGNKYTKESTIKMLDKVSKDFNVAKMKEDKHEKHIKSSNKFFSKLQDEVTSQIKKKSTDLKNNSKNSKKLSAKKVKL